ncbi:MAG: hypothetical protein ACD_21C00331G0012 [uncultured bacterium]|nr:MAG: hypothetical protein ACD_21C00331G0012 [uncultured bacterium]
MIKKILLSIVCLFYFQVVFAADDFFVYMLSYGKRNPVIVYCGITKDPERRARQHANNETMLYNTFDTMTVFAGPMPEPQAYAEETKCIYQYPIPKLYQTYPGNPIRRSEHQTDAEKQKAIQEYESGCDVSRLRQVLEPDVAYTLDVLKALGCEGCGAPVTERVIKYSQDHFDGQVFCMECQRQYR